MNILSILKIVKKPQSIFSAADVAKDLLLLFQNTRIYRESESGGEGGSCCRCWNAIIAICKFLLDGQLYIVLY
jgi:hypothetical protein